jgi:Pseudouridylate synthases, 23S RNA-specific
MYKQEDKYVVIDLNKENNKQEKLENIRIDKYLSNLEVLKISREKIKKGILSEGILLNLKKTKNSALLKKDDIIYIEKELLKSEEEIKEENLKAKEEILAKKNILKDIIIYEDKDLMVINKPKGIIVHKGSGTEEITLRRYVRI